MLHLTPHCRWVRLDDVVVILDLQVGEYLALDPADADLWEKLIAGQAKGAAADALLGDMRTRGWLGEADVAAPGHGQPQAPKSISAARAFIRLLQVRWLVRYAGFAAAYGWAATRAATPRRPATLPLAQALHAFNRAETLLPSALGLQDCLPRSLALFAFLVEAGYPVVHCIGVKRYPFAGHAWVMADAAPIHDNPEVAADFTTIAMIAA